MSVGIGSFEELSYFGTEMSVCLAISGVSSKVGPTEPSCCTIEKVATKFGVCKDLDGL